MAEAGEGLIESRAGGGLELAVRVVNDRTSFVSLPRDVLASLTARSPALPLPLALTPVERWLKRRGETAGPTTPKPAFVAWAGAASDGFGVVDVPAATADCLRLRDGCVVRVTGRAASPHATAVQLSPESEAEFAAIGGALPGVTLLANMVEGGRSPLLPREQLAQMGFRFIIYPVAAMATIAASLHKAYAQLATGDIQEERVSFKKLSQLVGFEAIEGD